MDMTTTKVAALEGAALDWAVAKIEGFKGSPASVRRLFLPSTDWAVGGPLIQKHQIELKWDGSDGNAWWWKAWHQDVEKFQMGDTPLIAVCRAICAAKLGDSISIPSELLG